MIKPKVQPSAQQEPAEQKGEPVGKEPEPASEDETALDLLEDEDRKVLELSSMVSAAREGLRGDVGVDRVHRRVEYGNRAKLLLRHLATREAASTYVAKGLAGLEGTDDLTVKLVAGEAKRRARLNRAEEMSRGVQGTNLNAAQDFDGRLRDLLVVVVPQAEWELSVGIPRTRRMLGAAGCRACFRSAKYVARHAPTHLSDGARRWHGRLPGLARAMTAIHHLRDFSRSTRDART